MSAPLSLPFHSEDLDIYRVGRKGLVLTAMQHTRDGKDEEHYWAEEADGLMPHCVKHLADNATEHDEWQLSIAVYGDEQVPDDFVPRVRADVEAEVARRRQVVQEAEAAKVKAKEDRERAEYDRLRVKFDACPDRSEP